jgi:16S rRNA (guanine527-N7)-methyltransferase
MLSLKNMNDFQNVSKDYGINISESQLNQFQKYHDFLLEWNKMINLISRQNATTETILERHFLDSIIFLPEIEGLIYQTPTVLDIGSGAGFPAIPLAIMKPEWDFTLSDATMKKANFLNELIKHLDLKNAKVENKRAEEIKNKYNFTTARAVAKIDELIKYSSPILKKGGSLLAFKGPAYEEELNSAKDLIESKKLKVKMFSKEVNEFSKKLVVITQP